MADGNWKIGPSIERVAVLVDGDNINAMHAEQVRCAGRRLGRVDVTRVYAAANIKSDWLTTPGYRVMHAGSGKNAADILLCIDAMELALTSGIENFVIATSDGDFSHVAQRLRERGLHVHGMGEAKSPQSFRLACTTFTVLKTARCSVATPVAKPPTPVAKPPAPVAKSSQPDVSELDRNIKAMIACHSVKGGGMRLQDLALKMCQAHGTRISTLSEKNWRAYLAKRPNLYVLDPRGPNATVRLHSKAFASASA
ncbi:Uncharacterized conserved protein, LabA/DUF88 family [Roseovarius lutimaris]|uniref:Uncharacterized conserved protein, LabA/DUF88 family n=1 Tax=Roseovarius lutimaris TaxID=1005928 RepID=A0A1I5B9S1_9RHOB|nr:NYN domain-containing protein [Roseovarius lutimaris]SFN71462.1 Uncharacterized conserved protein, LabA/DUF88 family [Roseovarius lutimaris]